MGGKPKYAGYKIVKVRARRYALILYDKRGIPRLERILKTKKDAEKLGRKLVGG